MPARRHQYGGGYGRRRRRLRGFAGVAVLLLGVIAAGYWIGRDELPLASLASCPTPSPTPTPAAAVVLPQPAQVRLTVLNGTPRQGLAKTVRDQLVLRRFVVLSEGNSPAALAGPSTVSYGPGGQPAATLLAHHVRGAKLVSSARLGAGAVQLVLGGDFARLATPAEASLASRPAPKPTLVASTPRRDCAP